MAPGPPCDATIVIPVLDQREDWLRQCVESALGQTRPTEVLVVHSPRTGAAAHAVLADLARRHGNLRLLPEARPGFAAAINTGIAAAACARVGLLLSDDWLQPDAVASCLPHDVDIVSTGCRVFLADGVTEVPGMVPPYSQARYEALAEDHQRADYLSHFFLFRRDALLRVGGVDEDAGNSGVDDFDMIWTLLEHGATVRVVPTRAYNYRDHDEARASLRDADAQAADMERILAKHGVPADRRQAIVARHRAWYGKTLRQARAEAMATPLGWAREQWRLLTWRWRAAEAADRWLRRAARWWRGSP
ncbi:MAG: glycosyltransferase [Hyphomicrobiales bacterium]|nr:glycosyltransferase [Hyphomicrobiales bacterium]